MANQFTQAFMRQVQQLLDRVSGGVNRSGQSISADFGDVGIELSSQQMMEILQGNSQWLDTFEQQIEQRFTTLSERVLNDWEAETERQLKRSLEQLATSTIELFGKQSVTGNNRQNPLENITGGNLAQRLGTLVRRSATEFVEDLFARTRTTSQETDRSTREAERYKASRGQVQAELSDELARGRRYQ